MTWGLEYPERTGWGWCRRCDRYALHEVIRHGLDEVCLACRRSEH